MLGAALGLIVLKAGLTAVLARAMGLRWAVGLPAGLLLGPGGEFSFVILGVGAGTGLLDADLAGFGFTVAALTMAAIPLLSRLGARLEVRRVAPIDPGLLPPDTADEAPRVILAGFGRVGRTVAALLDTHRIPYVALDNDAARVSASRRDGHPVYYGDVTQPELLRRVGLGDARALVVTVDDRVRADAVVRIGRGERPDLLIVVRARDGRHAAQLYALGASDAVPETIEASLQVAEAVLVDLGVPMGPVLVSIHEKRAEFQAEIKAAAPGALVRPLGQTRLRRRAPTA